MGPTSHRSNGSSALIFTTRGAAACSRCLPGTAPFLRAAPFGVEALETTRAGFVAGPLVLSLRTFVPIGFATGFPIAFATGFAVVARLALPAFRTLLRVATAPRLGVAARFGFAREAGFATSFLSSSEPARGRRATLRGGFETSATARRAPAAFTVFCDELRAGARFVDASREAVSRSTAAPPFEAASLATAGCATSGRAPLAPECRNGRRLDVR